MMEMSTFYLYVHNLYCFIEDYINNIEQSHILETGIRVLPQLDI